ncbi:MAG: N-acetylmuramoyl-L-alanine amidase [Acutalibacteraceae bacterium]
MAKKIYLSPSNQNANAYATGNTNEADQCNKIAKAAETALKRCGFEVKRAPQGQEMSTSIRESNSWKADLHIPIHTNAYNGKVTGGTLIMVYSNTGENAKAAKAIKAVLDPLSPGKDYEIQTRTDLSELSNTTAIAVYIECEFHDTKTGSDFIISHTTQLGEAIAKGICNYYGVTYKAPTAQADKPTGTAKKTVYRVQVGSYSVKANADALADKLKKQGYQPIVVKAEI